jgi:ABC-2 type transport system ATP-binding protein
MSDALLIAQGVSKRFRRKDEVVHALDNVCLHAAKGTLTALVGPDGAGKTTLIRLAAGLLTADAGALTIFGIDVAANPQQIQDRIGYMPQRFGLYEDLSVQENLDLYADLHGVSPDEQRERYPRLLEMTALAPFTRRLAGRLSGGMKQKLGLACTLIRLPELLLLDEPTVGVDPLSRRELWEIILQLVNEESLTVLLSTSYLDEAERCGYAVVLHKGKILAQGLPSEVSALAKGRTFLSTPFAGQKARLLQAQLLDQSYVVDAVPEGGRVRFIVDKESWDPIADKETWTRGDTETAISKSPSLHVFTPLLVASAYVPVAPRFEDGFMVLLRQSTDKETATDQETRRKGDKDPTSSSPGLFVSKSPNLPVPLSPNLQVSPSVVQVRDLIRRFGNFIAVDHVSFEVARGEIFGLLGPNGAGKTTTFRMLCGLLPATSGSLRVAGMDLRRASGSARQKIGYVAQKFSLYGQLSVSENLEFFASAYGLREPRRRERIDWALREFQLQSFTQLPSERLPGGYKQRLAMAAALLHEPEILFLDEPTSGADPLARREFWRRITELAEHGVSVIVTTHFMEEAEYCDRVVILADGRVLAQGTPAEVREHGRPAGSRLATMEDAFIAIVEQAREQHTIQPTGTGGGR